MISSWYYVISNNYDLVVLWYHSFYDIIVIWYHDHSFYDIIDCDILYDIWTYYKWYSISYIPYDIIYDGWISLCSPLPGLHSGLDSFRFNTITMNISLSTAGSILLRNQCLSIAVYFQILRYAAQALRGPGPALAPVLPGRRSRVDTLY